MSTAQGGCLCGALRYEVARQPAKITMCHCKFCQRATGGAYLVEPVFDAADFAMLQGAPKVYVHVSEGSGKEVNVNFCDACGTKIFLTFERFTGAVGLYGGTLDDPNWLEVPPEMSKHIFLNMAQKDTIIPPHVSAFAEHAAENDGTPIAPMLFDKPQKIGDL